MNRPLQKKRSTPSVLTLYTRRINWDRVNTRRVYQRADLYTTCISQALFEPPVNTLRVHLKSITKGVLVFLCLDVPR